MNCPICLEEIENYSYTTLCNHIFCLNCIYHWLQSHNTCPMCRFQLYPLAPIQETDEESLSDFIPYTPPPSEDESLDENNEDDIAFIREINLNIRAMDTIIEIIRHMYN